MELIFGYQGFDLGQFPDLVPQRNRVVPGQLASAATTGFRLS